MHGRPEGGLVLRRVGRHRVGAARAAGGLDAGPGSGVRARGRGPLDERGAGRDRRPRAQGRDRRGQGRGPRPVRTRRAAPRSIPPSSTTATRSRPTRAGGSTDASRPRTFEGWRSTRTGGSGTNRRAACCRGERRERLHDAARPRRPAPRRDGARRERRVLRAEGEPVKPEAPVFDPDRYTDRGKEMDGWETRRRREPGHDWCIVRLGIPGIVRGVVVDTSFFRGNYPDRCSVEGAVVEEDDITGAEWFDLLPESALEGDAVNRFDVASPLRVTPPAPEHLPRRRGREAPRPRRAPPGSANAHRRRRPRGRRGVVVGRGRARRERSVLLLAAQPDRAGRLTRHARRLGDATPARRRPRLGRAPPRDRDRDRARRGRHVELQGQLPRHLFARRPRRARRDRGSGGRARVVRGPVASQARAPPARRRSRSIRRRGRPTSGSTSIRTAASRGSACTAG